MLVLAGSKRQATRGGGCTGQGTGRARITRLGVEPDENVIQEVVTCARAFFDAEVDETDIRDLVTAAYRAEDLNYNAEVAAKWGKENFPGGIPAAVVQEHAARLEAHGGDFEAMARQQLRGLRDSRLKYQRIGGLAQANPERHTLRDLARGMHVPLEPGFTPNGGSDEARPKLRALYQKAHAAVVAKLYDLVENKLAMVLPMDMAKGIAGALFSPAHWATKQGKECGRPIVDSSDRSATTPVLNGRNVAAEAVERWGRRWSAGGR